MSRGILHPRAVAVVTGAASGIGLACAQYYAKEGLCLFLVDINEPGLKAATESIKKIQGVGEVDSMVVDLSKIDQVVALRDKVLDVFGEVHVLQNNAGRGMQSPAFSLEKSLAEVQNDWNMVMGTNFGGIMNVSQAFAPHMARQENTSVIINTGSKQGITCPPGAAGYNTAKSAVKTYTEQLAHELRNTPYSNCTAHLFVPGWTFTGPPAMEGKPKPPGAWSAEQTAEYMIEKVFDEGDFYVICPDSETSSALDKARIMWSLGDIIENRPALSRWHPEFKAKFEEFISIKLGLGARSRSRGRNIDRVSTPVPQAAS